MREEKKSTSTPCLNFSLKLKNHRSYPAPQHLRSHCCKSCKEEKNNTIKCDITWLTTDIHVSKLLSNRPGLMKITWPPVKVATTALGQSGCSAEMQVSPTWCVLMTARRKKIRWQGGLKIKERTQQDGFTLVGGKKITRVLHIFTSPESSWCTQTIIHHHLPYCITESFLLITSELSKPSNCLGRRFPLPLLHCLLDCVQ